MLLILAKIIGVAINCGVRAELDPQKVKEKAIEWAFAARTVIQQVANFDRTPEGLAAAELLEAALSKAIPNVPEEKGQVAAAA